MFSAFLRTFADYTLDVLPYFLGASVLGALLQSLWGERLIRSSFLRKPYAPVITASLGAAIPLCSCSMIPVARTIDSLSGRSYAPAVAFLITAPVLSPVTLLLTYGMFGIKLTLVRFLSTFLFAVAVAYLISLVFNKPPVIPLVQGGSGNEPATLWERFFTNFRSLFVSTGKYVLLGLFIAAVVKVLVPQSMIEPVTGSVLSYPLVSLISVPVYVCSGEEVPIARSLVDLGFKPGQALTFMLASSGICLPTVLALLSFFPRALVLTYTSAWFVFSALTGLLTDIIL